METPRDLRELTGSLLVVGFEGTTLPASLALALSRGERAGVILFKRNLPNAEVAKELPPSIHAARGAGLEAIVAIDQEGGRVARLPPPFKALPRMRLLGRGSSSLAKTAARAVGRDLRALGINLDFAPVLDVDSNPANPVIGDRSFGADPLIVTELGLAFAAGLNAGGVLACGKHFPGHGDTDTDSHHDLPVIRHDRARLDSIELAPFRAAARASMDSFMTAHVVIEVLDPSRPATISSAVITGLLRHQLHFGGVVFSDDLEMRAIAARMAVEDSAREAIAAGCDALLICQSEELAFRAHEALIREAEASDAFRLRCEEAAGRMAALRRRATTLKRDASMPEGDLWQDVERDIEALKIVESA